MPIRIEFNPVLNVSHSLMVFRFDYFARTVPPDTFQSIALVDVVKSANWSYVSTVYSEGSYGEYGIEVFTREATERNVCIAAALKVPSAADDKVYDDIIQRLSKKPNARAIVLFTRAEDARGILEAAKRLNLSQPFQVRDVGEKLPRRIPGNTKPPFLARFYLYFRHYKIYISSPYIFLMKFLFKKQDMGFCNIIFSLKRW